MNAAAIILFGAGLVVLGRFGRGSPLKRPAGVWSDPPNWARRLFGTHRDRIDIENLVIGAVGMTWLFGGAVLAATGLAPESTPFFGVVLVLVVLFFLAVIFSLAVWLLRAVRP